MLYECKVCGGNLVEQSDGMAKCESCRRIQSIPHSADADMMNRANRLRMRNKNFADSMKLYEKIIESSPEESEAYWGVVLCRYGIEYVEDKRTETYIPTCHRTIDTAIKDDADFITACEKATDEAKKYYIEQAEYIDEVQRKIHEIVAKEKPYDVFISYKATDDEGMPTVDSKEALKIYHKLYNQGYNVFFSEETLKSHAGEEYEPYIYAALKTSKIMILIGSKPEYFEAPWVKNEWTRFLDMMNGEKVHKKLLPFYFDMDAYDLPVELNGAEALNWRDAEAMSNLLSIVNNFFGAKSKQSSVDSQDIQKVIANREGEKAVQKLKNAIALAESGHRDEALKIISNVIDSNPDFYAAYWHRMLIRFGDTEESLISKKIDITKNADFVQAINTAPKEYREKYKSIADKCINNCKIQADYNQKYEELKEKYKSFEEEEKVQSLNSKIQELIKRKAYVPVSYSVNVCIIICTILWVFVAFCNYSESLTTSMLISCCFVMWMVILIALSYKIKSFLGNVFITTIITLYPSLIVMYVGSEIKLEMSLLISLVILGLEFLFLLMKIMKKRKRASLGLEMEACENEMAEFLSGLRNQFDNEYEELTNKYASIAKENKTFIDKHNSVDLYELFDKYLSNIKDNRLELLSKFEKKSKVKSEGQDGNN